MWGEISSGAKEIPHTTRLGLLWRRKNAENITVATVRAKGVWPDNSVRGRVLFVSPNWLYRITTICCANVTQSFDIRFRRTYLLAVLSPEVLVSLAQISAHLKYVVRTNKGQIAGPRKRVAFEYAFRGVVLKKGTQQATRNLRDEVGLAVIVHVPYR